MNLEPFPLVVDGGMSLAGSSGWMIRNTDECSLMQPVYVFFLLSYLGGESPHVLIFMGLKPLICYALWDLVAELCQADIRAKRMH